MVIQKSHVALISREQKIDYKDIDLLKNFISKQGKILPRETTGITIQQQRQVTKAIKRARTLSLLPFGIKQPL